MHEHGDLSGITHALLQEECPGNAKTAYEITFCSEGLLTYHFPDGCLRLQPDAWILCCPGAQTAPPVPLTGRECGITLWIEPEHLQIPMLGDVQPAHILSDLCSQKPCSVFSSPRMSGVFRELMGAVPDSPLYHLKITELFLLLRDLPADTCLTPSVCSERELRIAVNAFRIAMQQMGEHITVQELSTRTGVSPTRLKESVSRVYGSSVYRVIRAEKMQRAARELLATESRVIDIASQFGYENCSKFSQAFSRVMGVAPTVYRKTVRMEHFGDE